MNPSEAEVNTLPKIEQEQTAQAVQSVAVDQDSPPIKTEENQANWKAFREQREIDRKSRIEFEKKASEKAAETEALRAALEAITNKSTPRQDSYYDETEESEEARIEKRVVKILEERERQQEQQRAQREAIEYPQRLVSDYKDFNQVCSTENLDYLDYHYPEISVSFKHMPDGYEKWAAIYKATKKLVPNLNSSMDARRAEKNLSKPGSLSAPTSTPSGGAISASRLDEARKSDNWQRMQRTLKGLTP